ncbi:hypothetical protein HDU86_007367 [Geranomyces michiganensis]|nr:hypothetical protein HDU86_007367 [Geranomyces michiganensis]
MCGRTALALDANDIQVRVGASQWVNAGAYRPSHNVAPTRYQPVLRQVGGHDNNGSSSRNAAAAAAGGDGMDSPASADAKNRILHSMKWGVIPSWQKQTPNYKAALQTINARDDRVKEPKSMWSRLKQSKRCVVIAEGFFEWLKRGSERQPFYLYREDDRLLTFAGLYDTAMVDGAEVWSYTIITTSSSKALGWLHDRMPVVLDNEADMELWLDPAKKFTDEVSALMRPLESGLKWHPVSTFVSKVGNDLPQCVVPVTLPAEFGGKGGIMSFFKPATATPTSTTNLKTSSSPTKPTPATTSKPSPSPSTTTSATKSESLPSVKKHTPAPHPVKRKTDPPSKGTIESAFLRTPKVKPDDAQRIVAGQGERDDDVRFEQDLALAIKRSRHEVDEVKEEEEEKEVIIDDGGPSPAKRRRGRV